MFLEMKLRSLVPSSYIHVSVTELYFHDRSAYLRIGGPRSWEYTNRSQILEFGNWECGCVVSFLGTHISELVCNVEITLY
jgi:hypothetical protein